MGTVGVTQKERDKGTVSGHQSPGTAQVTPRGQGSEPAAAPQSLPSPWARHLSQQDLDCQGRGREGLPTPPYTSIALLFSEKLWN